jgi:hypothetical protein
MSENIPICVKSPDNVQKSAQHRTQLRTDSQLRRTRIALYTYLFIFERYVTFKILERKKVQNTGITI